MSLSEPLACRLPPQFHEYLTIAAYLGGVVFLLAFMLGIPWLLGGRATGRAKTTRLSPAWYRKARPLKAFGQVLLW